MELLQVIAGERDVAAGLSDAVAEENDPLPRDYVHIPGRQRTGDCKDGCDCCDGSAHRFLGCVNKEYRFISRGLLSCPRCRLVGLISDDAVSGVKRTSSS